MGKFTRPLNTTQSDEDSHESAAKRAGDYFNPFCGERELFWIKHLHSWLHGFHNAKPNVLCLFSAWEACLFRIYKDSYQSPLWNSVITQRSVTLWKDILVLITCQLPWCPQMHSLLQHHFTTKKSVFLIWLSTQNYIRDRKGICQIACVPRSTQSRFLLKTVFWTTSCDVERQPYQLQKFLLKTLLFIFSCCVGSRDNLRHSPFGCFCTELVAFRPADDLRCSIVANPKLQCCSHASWFRFAALFNVRCTSATSEESSKKTLHQRKQCSISALIT